MEKPRTIRINEKDNVAIVLDGLQKGEAVDVAGAHIVAENDIPPSHKIALEDIPEGGVILKYGEEIGRAGVPIPKGAWVHAHNIAGSADLSKVVEERFEKGLDGKEAVAK